MDEALLRKRLLAQEREAVKPLALQFAALVNSLDEIEPEVLKEKQHTLHRLLSGVELVGGKTEVLHSMNARQREVYSTAHQEIDVKLESIKEEIAGLREELRRERIVRRNKEEYDMVTKLILKYPDRADSEEAIARLNEEIGALREESRSIEAKREIRNKQFQLLLHAINELRATLDEEDEEKDDKDDKEEETQASSSTANDGSAAGAADVEMTDA